jgi:MFS family permease
VLGVRLGFILFGTFWGAWAVGALDIQEFLEISDGGLGLLVAATVVGTLAANVVAGALAERWGTSRATHVSLAAWGLAVLVLSAVPEPRAWMAVFLVVVALGGMLDVVLNIAGTGALHDQPGQLLRVHASYNLGTVAGAAVTGAALGLLGTWRWAFAAAGVGSLVVAGLVRAGRLTIPDVTAGEHARLLDALGELRRSRLFGLAAAFCLGAMVEGGIGTFGVLYLRDQLEVAALAGAGAYVVGQLLATTTRYALGAPSAERAGVQLRGGGAARMGLVVAGIGLTVEVLAGRAGVAALGLAVASMGVATYWPLLSAVAVQLSDRPGLAVGGVTAAGYLGFLAGPPLVGLVADHWGLEAGVFALVVAAAGAAAATLLSPLPTGSSPGAGRAR